jgi:hypothetical protein
MEEYIQRYEEEILHLKEHEKDVEIMNNSERCEIYVHALASFSAPQTLKIGGYIKKKRVVVLIDSGSTHKFIDKILAETLNCFVYLMTFFQVLVANGGRLIVEENATSLKLVWENVT